MIEINNTDVYGFEAAFRGMRAAKQSWKNSDTRFAPGKEPDFGFNDVDLATKLSKAGDDHAKYLRMITVTCDITAPIYFWKEFDTYKVGTCRLSTSTMHTLANRDLRKCDFSTDYLSVEDYSVTMNDIISRLNYLIGRYRLTHKKDLWESVIQLLPSSFNQMSVVQMNYQVIKHMYHARKNHKLREWHTFCEWVETLPLFEELIRGDK